MHSWDDFRFFLAVADAGSFSQAAKRLKVNHSTVSRRIQVLEEKHHVRLFDRTLKGYELTSAGASIYDIADEMRSAQQKASRILMGQDSRLAGRIGLTMPHDIFHFFLAKPLRVYSEQNPAITIDLEVSKGLRDLANREADMAIRISPSPPDYLIGKCVAHLQHGIYARSSAHNAHTQTNLIVWSHEKEIPQWAIQHCINPKIVLRVDDLLSMYRAVQEGFGCARMPCFLPDKIADTNVYRRPIDLPRSDWGIWLLLHPDLRNTTRIQHCKNFLMQHLERMKPFIQGDYSKEENK